MKLHLIVVLALTACSGDDDTAYTWGDAASQISTDYCDMAARCGYAPLATCPEHTRFHLCVAYSQCDTEIPAECEQAVDDCSTAMDAVVDPGSFECFALFWGFTPPECSPAFDCQPERDPNDH